MQPISNSLPLVIPTPVQTNSTSSANHHNNKIFNNREEAISHIKTLTNDPDGASFEPENTIGELKGRTDIPLNTLELSNGEKQYYVTANMDPRKFFFLESYGNDSWNINELDISHSGMRQVVFIFGAEKTSATLPADMKLLTEKIEKKNDVYYVYCNPNIKFSLHEEKLSSEEIDQKADLINNIKLEPQRKSELIELLNNCTSRNPNCSNKDALQLCKMFPSFFNDTDKITPEMQSNAHKLTLKLSKIT
ncbi:hypothetical protein QVN83_11770 [Yersinia frederiksenii]|uniref:hypothetical protein n=1 Tax=Yersinia frederiksenii TaxID=29484 RepID=UPI0025AA5A97|nr:hypothetical protein [Yersinia frederiksenii]MDN0119647.1 hypothetical protein [Yersinia frederiksenii]